MYVLVEIDESVPERRRWISTALDARDLSEKFVTKEGGDGVSQDEMRNDLRHDDRHLCKSTGKGVAEREESKREHCRKRVSRVR